jgi:hypothetical protein
MNRPGGRRPLVAVAGAFVVVAFLGFLFTATREGDETAKRHGPEGRADIVAFQRLKRDPVVNLRPPEATILSVREIGPCEGDSGFGLSVVLSGSAPGRDEEILRFYQEKLPELGWTGVSRLSVPNADGDSTRSSPTEPTMGTSFGSKSVPCISSGGHSMCFSAPRPGFSACERLRASPPAGPSVRCRGRLSSFEKRAWS